MLLLRQILVSREIGKVPASTSSYRLSGLPGVMTMVSVEVGGRSGKSAVAAVESLSRVEVLAF